MTLRAVAFGDIGLRRWGAAFGPGGDLPSFAVLGPEPAVVISAALEGESGPGAEWWISGEGLELTVAPQVGGATDASTTSSSDDDSRRFDQLVSVTGLVPGDGARDVDYLGCRSERGEELRRGGFKLARAVGAWFSPDDGLALLAVRPRRASGHGDESLSATLFEAGHPLSVSEPRLSTTYDEEGLPTRATVELWLAKAEDNEHEDSEESVHYPRRAAGEAQGRGVTREVGPLRVHVRPFRWRAAGREGAGIYLLAWAT